jgi:uncharacterized protein YabE (DUF348 family)
MWAPKNVTLLVDETVSEIKTSKTSVRDCIRQAGIVMGPDDMANLPLEAKVKNGITIEVYRGGPVKITADGKVTTVVAAKATVGDVLDAAGIVLQEKDLTVPDRATRFKPGMEIRVIRVNEQTQTREKPILYTVERRADNTLEQGVTHIMVAGRDGLKRETAIVRYEDGREITATVLEEQVITPPQPEIVLVGTRDTVETSRGTMRFSRALVMEATAYLPTDGNGEGITAIGIPARHGIVAVDPKVIPLGARVYVTGYGVALAADTGGAIRGEKIDLCMENASEAWKFGRRSVKVYVLAE